MKKSLPAFCVALTLLNVSLAFSAEGTSETMTTQETICGKSPQHMWAGVRYTTPRGMGYSQGYTTVEGFFAPRSLIKDALLPFADVRGHVFDNGKLAANVGLGVRYLLGSRIWGANTYYDYRNTKRQHYNQVAVGFESLGRVWDFRLNGYLPVGWRHSPLFFPRFAAFSGNQLLIRRSQQFAFSDVNAEAGFHLDRFKNAPLYFAAGPYFLTGAGKTAWGGSLRARVDLLKYLRIEGNTSYDHFFKWVGQGQVSVNIPFGGRSKVMKREGHSCSQEMALSTRIAQRIDRNEIIPVGQKQVVSTAINPVTGLPWHVVFVNNLSASHGTYESPYHSLVDAQNNSSPNDMVYVFGGDGTTRNMNAGITLQNGQLFLGASTSHPVATTVGSITIPVQNTILPSITNTAGDVVTLANNNTVSGFSLTEMNTHNGIAGTGIKNLTINQNRFTITSDLGSGIYLEGNLSGDFLIDNNFFTGVNEGNGFIVDNSTSPSSSMNKLIVSNNTFAGNADNGDMIAVILYNSSINQIIISNNSMGSPSAGANGIGIECSNATVDQWIISNNLFSNWGGNSVEGINGGFTNSTVNTFSISSNSFNNINGSTTGIDLTLNNLISSSPVDISHNTFTGTGSNGWASTITLSNGASCLNFMYNSATLNSTAAYSFVQTGGIFNLTTGSNGLLNQGDFSNTGVIGSCSN